MSDKIDKKFEVPEDLAEQFEVSDVEMGPPVPDDLQPGPDRKKYSGSQKKTAPAKKAATTKAAAAAQPATPTPTKSRLGGRLDTHKVPWKVGERMALEVNYIGMMAGEIEMAVLPPKMVRGREVHHIQGRGNSSSIFALFYRLRDVAETFIDKEGLYSHKFVFKADESRQQRDLLELYDQEQGKVHYWHRHDHKKKGFKVEKFTADIEKYTQDALSSAFYLRTLPLKTGDVYKYPVVSSGKPWEIEARVLRREKINTHFGRKDAVVVQPVTKFEGVASASGDSFIWFSDDEHRIILKIEARVKVGSITAYIKEIQYGSEARQ